MGRLRSRSRTKRELRETRPLVLTILGCICRRVERSVLTSSQHWFPISFQSKHVGDIMLNGMLSILR